MEAQAYCAKLLGELNEQRKRDFFCDCSIIVEGRIFKAHRNILFANSGYFRALLIHYIQDSGRHSTASLDIVTSDAFSTILDFLYSGKLDLCGENVIEVMSAASYLQMNDVVNFCKTYIRSSLDICRKMEKEAAVAAAMAAEAAAAAAAHQIDSGSPSSGLEGTSCCTKSFVSSPGEGEGSVECIRASPCEDCHPLELVVRDSQGSGASDRDLSVVPRRVEPKVEFDIARVEGEAGEGLQQYVTPLAHAEQGLSSNQALDLTYSNYHVKQFLEALLHGGAVQSKEDADRHFSHSLEGRLEGAGVAMSSVMDVQNDWYREDSASPSVFHLLKSSFMDYQFLKNKPYSKAVRGRKTYGKCGACQWQTQGTMSFQPIPLVLEPDLRKGNKTGRMCQEWAPTDGPGYMREQGPPSTQPPTPPTPSTPPSCLSPEGSNWPLSLHSSTPWVLLQPFPTTLKATLSPGPSGPKGPIILLILLSLSHRTWLKAAEGLKEGQGDAAPSQGPLGS
ncbi:zinc finger and BTB domain-containing protein 8B [Peromyscus leucopus]|uniref:zinc finger and BTB domain-containing protein 8B n=1 Tax=Peromyscus leucopus TaxID=10041 RepID=UPI001884A22C|nr:zinc finger and BTB domain-containing protein 8B [Peromyscus leucopus]